MVRGNSSYSPANPIALCITSYQPNSNKNVLFPATVRNLLVMSSVFSVLTGVILLITSVMLLDALRKEQETAFKGKFETRTTLYCMHQDLRGYQASRWWLTNKFKTRQDGSTLWHSSRHGSG